MNKAKLIVVATPTRTFYGPSIHFYSALTQLRYPNNSASRHAYVVGLDVAEARNSLVATAFSFENDRTEVGHIFWIDDDVICHPHVLLRLMSHRKPIASGVYFTKNKVFSQPLILPAPGGGMAEFIPNQLMEVWASGSGLTLVDMDVYRKLRSQVGVDAKGNPEYYKTTTGGGEYLGDMAYLGGTEDTYFCNLAKERLNVPTWVDTDSVAFGWHLDRETLQGYPRPQFEQMQRGESVVWETSKGTITWACETPKGISHAA